MTPPRRMTAAVPPPAGDGRRGGRAVPAGPSRGPGRCHGRRGRARPPPSRGPSRSPDPRPGSGPRAAGCRRRRASPPSATGSRSPRSRFDHLGHDHERPGHRRRSPGPCSTSACPRPSSTGPSGASPTARTPRSTCAWTPTTRGPPPTWSTATAEAELARVLRGVRRRALRPPHRPRHRGGPAHRDHGRAGRHRARRHPRAGPPPRRPSGQAHVPGHPHRGQPRARRPARRPRRGHRADPARRPRRRRSPTTRARTAS